MGQIGHVCKDYVSVYILIILSEDTVEEIWETTVMLLASSSLLSVFPFWKSAMLQIEKLVNLMFIHS